MAQEVHWLLVMNTSRARILRDLDGAAPPPLPLAELVMRSESRHLRAALDGTARITGGPGGGSGEMSRDGFEPLTCDRKAFVRDVLALLEVHRRAADFDRLAVFAPAEMLDILQQRMSPAQRRRSVLSRAADLIAAPARELTRMVRHGLEGGS